MDEGAAGVSKKSRAGHDGIPPFKKRRVGHLADDGLVVNKLRVYLPLKREDNQRAIPLHWEFRSGGLGLRDEVGGTTI